MLFEMVEKLVQNPSLIDHVKDGKVDFPGVSEIEKEAIIDVFTTEDVQGIEMRMCYWK